MNRPGNRFLFELPAVLFGEEADAAAAVYCEADGLLGEDHTGANPQPGEIRFLLYRGRDLSIIMLDACEAPAHVREFAWSYATVLSLIDPQGNDNAVQ